MGARESMPFYERPARERVVVTGMGVVAPPGNNLDTFWETLVAGRSNARLIDRFDTTAIASKFACHVEGFDPTNWIDKKEARRFDRFVQFAVAGARMALE